MDLGGDGPEDRDWRVPVSELRARRERLSEALLDLDFECVIIEDPVELYWLTGAVSYTHLTLPTMQVV